jgi:hypothetical protein
MQGGERTDAGSVEEKWAAVIAQEKYYASFLGVKLAQYRNRLDIANTSWNGAVKGYLV